MNMKKSISSLALFFVTCIIVFCATTSNGQSDNCKILDITKKTQNLMPCFDCLQTGAGLIIQESIGIFTVTGKISIGTHLGTHVDSPSHVFPKLFDKGGFTADALDLRTLIGPVLVVEVPKGKNIDAEVMKSLAIPPETKRVIFKTSNSCNPILKVSFLREYAGFTEDGAEWLVDNTNITFVGIDYMSAAVYDQIVPVHKTLMNGNKIIPVENLLLDNIAPGNYNVMCLPMKIVADAAPVRCILVDPSCPMQWSLQDSSAKL